MPLVEKDNFTVELVTGKDAAGRDVLVLVAKRTYRLDAPTGRCTLDGVDEQPPVHGDDVYAEGGDFFDDVLQEDGEMAPFKPKVDVVVRARAFAPGGKPVPRFETSVQVGRWQKRLTVIGDRRCVWQPPKKETKKEIVFRPPLFTEPEPIAECPVTWRHAYGGSSPVLPLIPPHLREQVAADLEAKRSAKAEAAKAEAAAQAGAAPDVEAFQQGATQTIDLNAVQAAHADSLWKRDDARADVGADGTQVLHVGRTVEAGDGWDDALRGPAPQAAAKPKAELPDDRIPCPFNPVGKGFALGHSQEALDGLALPNLEDPARPLVPEMIARDLTRLLEPDVVPAGLGFVAKGAWMRAQFAGYSPEEAEAAKAGVDEQLANLDPADPAERPAVEALLAFEPKPFDPTFWNGAPLDQQLPDLVGDEVVTLTNLDPSGHTQFQLPGRAPLLTLDRGRGPEPVLPRLDTLVIDREAERVTLVWRGHLAYGGPSELESYQKLVGDVRDLSLPEQREQAALLRAAPDPQERGTEVLKVQDDAEPVLKHAPVAPSAAKRASALAEGAEAADEDDRGTRVIRLAEEGRELQADTAWVAGEKAAAAPGLTPEQAEAARKAAEIAAKKQAIVEKLAALKAAEAEAAKKKK
jgi:hypothetical protein